MGKHERLAEKFFLPKKPGNIRFGDVKSMLKYFGCKHINGKGSANKFIHENFDYAISIHAHDDGYTLKAYEVENVKNALIDLGVNDEEE